VKIGLRKPVYPKQQQTKEDKMEFPVQGTTISYIVEERPVDAPSQVSFAWSVARSGDASSILLAETNRHPDRLYRIYCSVEME
jgi:hypothetical protein